MRKNRFIGQDRCYHLISRLAHRAFFLDDEEKDRAVRLKRRIFFLALPYGAADGEGPLLARSLLDELHVMKMR